MLTFSVACFVLIAINSLAS